AEVFTLIIDQNALVAHHVHEQDMSYLKMKIWFGFGDRQSILNLLQLSLAKISLDSRFPFRHQLLKARIVPDRIPNRIDAHELRCDLRERKSMQQPFKYGNRLIGVPEHRVDLRSEER